MVRDRSPEICILRVYSALKTPFWVQVRGPKSRPFSLQKAASKPCSPPVPGPRRESHCMEGVFVSFGCLVGRRKAAIQIGRTQIGSIFRTRFSKRVDPIWVHILSLLHNMLIGMCRKVAPKRGRDIPEKVRKTDPILGRASEAQNQTSLKAARFFPVGSVPAKQSIQPNLSSNWGGTDP